MFGNIPHDFLVGIKQIVTGANRQSTSAIAQTPGSVFYPATNATISLDDGGIIVDIPFDIGTFHPNTASGVVLTTPSAATGSIYLSLGNNSSTTNSGYLQWSVPRDYDEASDQFSIRIELNQAAQVTDKSVQIVGALTLRNVQPNSSPTVLTTTTAAVYATVPFSANAGTTSSANGANITAVAPNTQVVELVFTGNGLKRDMIVTAFIRPSGSVTAGDNVQIYGFDLTYASTLVSYNPTDGTGNFTNSVNPGANMGLGVAPMLNTMGNKLR